MRFSERTFGAASVGLGVILIAIMSTALTAFDGMGAWVVALLGGAVLIILFVLAGVGIAGVSKALALNEQQSLIDPLTGLSGADQLTNDLADALAQGSDAVFSLHLLDGFKSYNEAYGRACGDTMLVWLADKLRVAANGSGRVYRMRGGEFALLASGTDAETLDVRAAVADALLESGEGFIITSRFGEVVLPGQTQTVSEALKLADHRAQSQRKAGRRDLDVAPPEDAIETARIPASPFDVAELATEVGRRMGLPADRLDDLAAAAHLRDLGNMALPGEILRGEHELTAAEWDFIRLHTIVGERLLSANFAMTEVGRLVRSSHERWDGGGYPDGLSGEGIPLGSRVVFVCTAFQDMTSTRPYREALSVEEALEQLREAAGSQFDPEVVRVFDDVFERVAGGGRKPSVAPPLRRLRVLVADDDAASRFLLWRAVEAAGHECVAVASGNAALDTFRHQLPDIVLCDARLPQIDGHELCRLIRAEPNAPHTYFVMLTALGDLGLLRGESGTGADDFLTKPIAREDLDARLLTAARGVMAQASGGR
jgi:diguanylate cyclase (GGDEF)-like protein